MFKGKAVTILLCLKSRATGNSMDGIVLWELLEQKCQQHMWHLIDVVQSTLAGCMVLILLWNMVRLTGKSASVLFQNPAPTKPKFWSRTAHPIIFTNLFIRPGVICATVAQTDYAERNLRNNRIHNRCFSVIWCYELSNFHRFLRWCRLLNHIIKKNLICNDSKDS